MNGNIHSCGKCDCYGKIFIINKNLEIKQYAILINKILTYKKTRRKLLKILTVYRVIKLYKFSFCKKYFLGFLY